MNTPRNNGSGGTQHDDLSATLAFCASLPKQAKTGLQLRYLSDAALYELTQGEDRALASDAYDQLQRREDARRESRD